MIDTIKNALKSIPLVKSAYTQVRRMVDKNEGRKLFENYDVYVQALNQKGDGTVVLHTHDGLSITIRQNIWDARIIKEIYFEKPYIRHINLPENPVIVDIGGYIGDFSIYAAKYLKAKRVIVYEPTVENFEILQQNIANNNYADRIIAINKAVSIGDEVVLNVQVQEKKEVHVSASWYRGAEQRRIPSVTLFDLFEIHGLGSVDLLKIDCEGGEYDIFPTLPDYLFNRIRNIAFEYHRIPGFEPKLELVLSRLRLAGYAISKNKEIVIAHRT